MRIGSLIVLLLFAGAFSSAHADVTLSGFAETFGPAGGATCLDSGTSSSSLSLSCGLKRPRQEPPVWHGGSLDGSLFVVAVGDENAIASVQVDLNEWLVANGSGPATLSFLLEFPGSQYGNEGGLSCLIAVDGVSQSCGDTTLLENGIPESEVNLTIDSDVPFSLELQIGRYALAEGETGGSTVTYSLIRPA